MASVNKVILVGNLTRDPDIRYSNEGKMITKIAVATGRGDKDTEYTTVVLFGQQAEVAGQWLKKGRQVYIEGRLSTSKYQDKEGQTRYTTEVIASDMQLLGPKEKSADEKPVAAVLKPPVEKKSKSFEEAMDEYNDDIPF